MIWQKSECAVQGDFLQFLKLANIAKIMFHGPWETITLRNIS